MKRTLFFDLDGTLLDVQARYYQLYCDLAEKDSTSMLTSDAYWELKRKRLPEPEILERSGFRGPVERYVHMRTDRIEDRDYLARDTLQPGAREVLADLRRDYELVLVTLRRSGDNLEWQLRELGLGDLLHRVLRGLGDEHAKASLIANGGVPYGSDDLWIGDTEVDLRAAALLGIRCAAVLSGIRDQPLLTRENPDFMIADIRELPTLLRRLEAEREDEAPEQA